LSGNANAIASTPGSGGIELSGDSEITALITTSGGIELGGDSDGTATIQTFGGVELSGEASIDLSRNVYAVLGGEAIVSQHYNVTQNDDQICFTCTGSQVVPSN